MSLHRAEPRFVLPHAVRRAVVLDALEAWRVGLESAGVQVEDPGYAGPSDLVVSPARLVAEARRHRALSVIVEGSRTHSFRAAGRPTRRLLLRPTRERPTLALPLDQRLPTTYALERWSVL